MGSADSTAGNRLGEGGKPELRGRSLVVLAVWQGGARRRRAGAGAREGGRVVAREENPALRPLVP